MSLVLLSPGNMNGALWLASKASGRETLPGGVVPVPQAYLRFPYVVIISYKAQGCQFLINRGSISYRLPGIPMLRGSLWPPLNYPSAFHHESKGVIGTCRLCSVAW